MSHTSWMCISCDDQCKLNPKPRNVSRSNHYFVCIIHPTPLVEYWSRAILGKASHPNLGLVLLRLLVKNGKEWSHIIGGTIQLFYIFTFKLIDAKNMLAPKHVVHQICSCQNFCYKKNAATREKIGRRWQNLFAPKKLLVDRKGPTSLEVPSTCFTFPLSIAKWLETLNSFLFLLRIMCTIFIHV